MAELLGSIAWTDRVYETVMRPALPQRGRHTTTSARITFFERHGAERLLLHARAGLFIVRDRVPRVQWSPVPNAPSAPVSPTHSRALFLLGPATIINEQTLMRLWRRVFSFELSMGFVIDDYPRLPGLQAMVFHFGSFQQAERAQQIVYAQAFNGMLSDAEQVFWSAVRTHYALDPCQFQLSGTPFEWRAQLHGF